MMEALHDFTLAISLAEYRMPERHEIPRRRSDVFNHSGFELELELVNLKHMRTSQRLEGPGR